MTDLTPRQEYLLAWVVTLMLGAIWIHVLIWRAERRRRRGRSHRDS